jgi:hypothetical protein
MLDELAHRRAKMALADRNQLIQTARRMHSNSAPVAGCCIVVQQPKVALEGRCSR